MARKKESSSEAIKSLSVFDHVNAIYKEQNINYFDKLTDKDKSSFSPYMISRIISMNPDYLPYINEIQKYNNVLSKKALYHLYISIFPKTYKFYKYISKKSNNIFQDWYIDLMVKYLKCSKTEAIESLIILKNANRDDCLTLLCELYGVEEKQRKKIFT